MSRAMNIEEVRAKAQEICDDDTGGPTFDEYTLAYAVVKLLKVVEASQALRTTQRAYMADRGNEEKGKAVGEAATALDVALIGVAEATYPD